MWRRDGRSAEDELAAECEAFLAGRYPEYLRYRGHAIPAWAWTNPLAHAPEDQLRTMISTRGGAIGPPGGWAHACCYLAGELLDLAEQRGPLTELQATALVPLELVDAGGAPGCTGLAGGNVAGAVALVALLGQVLDDLVGALGALTLR